ncbi:MAG: hypothetical protein Q4A55_06710 [Aerococcus sp.]|nr:hypothetical protein [Aerococcus sp.]
MLRDNQLEQVKCILREYPEIPGQLRDIREKIWHPRLPPDENIGGSHGPINPNKDVDKILTIVDDRMYHRLTHNEEMVKRTLQESEEWVKQLIALMYFRKPPLGIVIASGRVHANYRTAKRYHDDFIDRLAKRLGFALN